MEQHVHCYDNGETLRLALSVDHMLPTFGYKRGVGMARATIGYGDIIIDGRNDGGSGGNGLDSSSDGNENSIGGGNGIYDKYDILKHAHGDVLNRDINVAHTFDYSVNIDPITAYFSSSNNIALWSTTKQKYSTKDGKIDWTSALNTAVNQLLAPLYDLLTTIDTSHKTNDNDNENKKADLDDAAILELEALFNKFLDAETNIEEELTELTELTDAESPIKDDNKAKINDKINVNSKDASELVKAQTTIDAKIPTSANTQQKNNPTSTSKSQNTPHTSIKAAINEYKNGDEATKSRIAHDYLKSRGAENDGQVVQSYIIEEFIIDALITKQLAKPLLGLGKTAATWLKDKYKEFTADSKIANIDNKTYDPIIEKVIEWDKQGKHIPGHKNFLNDNRSVITIEKNKLIKLVKQKVGTGQAKVGQKGIPGYREVVDFGEEIGFYIDKDTKIQFPTTKGTIHYSKRGIHVVPARP